MEYRAIRNRGEWDEAMVLWTSVFGVGSWLFQSLSDGTTGRSLDHTLVAVDNGRIVSSVDVFMRQLRGIDGRPLKVGGIGSVATYEDARRQGHSGKLIEGAIAMMENEGCAWSFLFTGTHHHYERYGWKTVPLTGHYGTFLEEPSQVVDGETELLNAESGWPLDDLAKVYETFNQNRPLTHVRSALNWDTAVRIRLERPDRKTWVSRQSGEIVAYVSATFSGEEASIDEACCATGAADAFPALFCAAAQEAKSRGVLKAVFLLPAGPEFDSTIKDVAETEVRPRGHTMVRRVGNYLPESYLPELFAATGRQHYELDNF